MLRNIAVVVVSLGVLAGCSGSPDEATPKVVSLQSPGSATAPAKPPATPVIRPDTTAAEVLRMQQPWMKCLKDNGIPMTTRDGLLDIDAKGNSNETNGRIMAMKSPVSKICGQLMPVLAPELDEDKNPYWADDNNNYNECLVEGGVPLVKKDGEWRPGPGWNDTKPNEPLELSCQAKAFDGKKG